MADEVQTLIAFSAHTGDSGDAQRYSQAALNCAHAQQVVTLTQSAEVSDAQIKHMVNRFLGWKLPKDFSPDNGIRYTPTSHDAATGDTPSGTNVFDATQADAMVRYMVKGMT